MEIKEVLKNKYIIIMFLLFMMFSIFFSISAISEHNHFGSWAWDLGLYDQGIWLIKHNQLLFNTVRGLHQFGDHITFINYFVSLIFFIKEDVRLLLIFQSIWIVSTIFPIYLLSKKLFKKEIIGLLLSIAFLLYPAVQYSIIEDFHPETLSLPFILWVFYFAENKSWLSTIIFSILTLLIKEDFAVTVFLIGLFIFFKYNKKIGIIISSISIAWLIFIMLFLLKFFNGIGYWRNLYGWNIFARLGNNFSDIIKNVFIQPIQIFKILFAAENFNYLLKMLLPMAFLPILNSFVVILLPLVLINLLAGGYLISVVYHYTLPLTPLLFVSLILTIKKYNKFAVELSLLILVFSIIGNISYAPEYSSLKNMPKNLGVFRTYNDYSDKELKIYNFISQIPDDAKVSATHLYVPHLTHRRYIYMFPNPYKLTYWGIAGENPPEKNIDYILVDKKLLREDEKKIIDDLINNKEFLIIDGVDETVFLKKNLTTKS